MNGITPSDLWRVSASAANSVLFAMAAYAMDDRLRWWLAGFAASWAMAAIYHSINAVADWIDSRGL